MRNMVRRWGLPILLSALAVTAAVVTLVLILSAASPSGDGRVDDGCYPGESCYP